MERFWSRKFLSHFPQAGLDRTKPTVPRHQAEGKLWAVFCRRSAARM